MIIWIIIILAVALVALLIDWTTIANKLPKRSSEGRRTAKPAKPSKLRPDFSSIKRAKTEVMRPQSQQEAIPADDFMEQMNPQTLEPAPAPNSQYAPDVQELLNEADIFFRKGEYKAAEQYYLKAAAKDPRCSKAYSRLGVIYLENGEEWQDAEEAFRQALKTDQNNGYIMNNLGLVLYHQDKYADAIRHFEMAVRQDELNANRHANLGKAYMAMRQYAKAESSFKKALKMAPNELEYKDLLAEAMEKKQAHKAMIRR